MLEIFLLRWLASVAEKKGRSQAWAGLAILLGLVLGLFTSALGEGGFIVGYLGGYALASLIVNSLSSLHVYEPSTVIEPPLPTGPTMKQEVERLTVPVARAEGIDLGPQTAVDKAQSVDVNLHVPVSAQS